MAMKKQPMSDPTQVIMTLVFKQKQNKKLKLLDTKQEFTELEGQSQQKWHDKTNNPFLLLYMFSGDNNNGHIQ